MTDRLQPLPLYDAVGSHRKQHYVPQSYLKAWSLDGRRIWLFDKRTGGSRLVGTPSVAQETYFNDAFRRGKGQVTDAQPPDLIERQFRIWEDQLLTMRRVALDAAADRRAGTLEERQIMATCAALQLLRTAKARSALVRQAAEAWPEQRTDLRRWLPAELQQRIAEDPGFVEEHISFIQTYLLWRTDIIPQLATELYHYLWLIAKNPTGFPFYTSDAPIAALTHGKGEPPFYPTPRDTLPAVKGLYYENPLKGGLELIFPVSPDCAVLMFHPDDFDGELGDKQGKVLVLGRSSVQIRNVVIAGQAVRQVFSTTDDFHIAAAAAQFRASD